MPYDITLIPGDGTGPEIVEATRRAIEATGVPGRGGRGGFSPATSGTDGSDGAGDAIFVAP